MKRSGDKYKKTMLVKVSRSWLRELLSKCTTDEVVIPVKADVYDVINAWEVGDPGCQQGVKKLLMPGSRHQKSKAQDLKESIDAVQRDVDYEELKEAFAKQEEEMNKDGERL